MNENISIILEMLKKNNFKEAITQCKNLLKIQNHPQVHLFLAIAYGEIGKQSKSSQIFDDLIKHFPNNSEIYYNYALICQKNKHAKNALNMYRECLKLNPQNASAWNNMGEIFRNNKQMKDALNAYKHAINIQTNNLHYIRNLGTTYYQSSEFENASQILSSLIETTEFDLDVCIALLDSLVTLKHLKQATKIGLIAKIKFPNNTEILNLIGLCELEKRKFSPAIYHFKSVLKIENDNFNAISHLASCYFFSGKQAKGLALLKELKKINSESSWIYICLMYETNNQKQLLNESIINGLKHYPNSAELHLFNAKRLKGQKQYKQSINSIKTAQRLNQDKHFNATIQYEKAQILDKMSHYKKAWKAIKYASDLTLKNWRKYTPYKDQFNKNCQQIVKSFQSASPKPPNSKGEMLGQNLIFVVGFPRSGTTLLDSILSAHSMITILEEAPVIGETYDEISKITPKNYAEKINKLSNKKLNRLRQFYFNALKSYSDWKQEGVLVDKSPLNTVHVALIHTLFPQAKILFSQRHPLDVCLSCYFQDFKMNSFMTNLTSIKKAAATYSSMLNVWKTSVEQLNIPVYYQSYEKLVSEFENQVKDLFLYLELPWQKKVLNYQKELSKRGAIATPSYNQVNQPIYSTSKNRYINYLNYLDKPSQILTPWIDYFNYSI